MKASILIKVLFVLPFILFLDYILMIIVGCTGCLFGAGKAFFCGPFCILGKIILFLSLALYIYLFLPELNHLFKFIRNATTSKKPKNLRSA
jgi:hypothetical protein